MRLQTGSGQTESGGSSVLESGRFPFEAQNLKRVFVQREDQVTCRHTETGSDVTSLQHSFVCLLKTNYLSNQITISQ